MIKVWDIPENYPNRMILDLRIHDKENNLRFTNFSDPKKNALESPFNISWSSIVLEKFPVLYSSSMMPLIRCLSHIKALDAYASSLELVPLTIRCSDAVEITYHLICVTNEKEIIDLERSKFVPIPGTNEPMVFKNVTFINNNYLEGHIARDKNYGSVVFVDDYFINNIPRDLQKWIGLGNLVQ